MPIPSFDDDLAYSLRDVGEPVVYGTQKDYGLLNHRPLDKYDPASSRYRGTLYELSVAEGRFADLIDDTLITVAGISYTIRDIGSAATDGLRRLVLTLGAPVADPGVLVTPANLVVAVGSLGQLTATAFDSGGRPIPGATFMWETSDPSIATVDSMGKVTGVANGIASITATYNGTVGACSVTVGNLFFS